MSKITCLLLDRNKNNEVEIDDQVALLSRDPNHTYRTNHPYYEIASIVNSKTSTVNKYQTTYDQTVFLDNLKNKNVFIAQAGTGFGKTWLSSSHYEMSKDSGSYLHIVPNDILVSQGIWQVGDAASEEFEFSKRKYIFATPEKTFGNIEVLLDNFERFDKIIFDEAHLLFGNKDHRANFYNFVFKKLYERKTIKQQFVILSPFLSDENIEEIKRECDNVIFEKFEGFTSEFIIKDIDTNKYLLFDDKTNIDKIVEEQQGIELYYFTSAKKARENFEESLSGFDKGKLQKFIQKLALDKNIKESWEMCRKNIDYIYNYDLILGLSKGIALYHGNVPNSVKNLIFVLAKNKYLKRIYGTQALLNGADMKIKKIVIDSTKNKSAD